MTREEYRKRMSEIYNEIGQLASERDMMVVERIALIQKDLEDIGLVYGMEVSVVDGIIERECVFNGVQVNAQHQIYLEFTYHSFTSDTTSFYSVLPKVVDINHNIKVILPQATFDYRQFMSQYI